MTLRAGAINILERSNLLIILLSFGLLGVIVAFSPYVVLGSLFLLALGGLIMTNLSLGITIGIASVAFYDIGVLHTPLADFRPFHIVWILIAGSLIASHLIQRRTILKLRSSILWPFIIFILINFLSVFFSSNPLTSIRESIQILYFSLIFFLVINFYGRDKKEIIKALNILFWITLLFILFGFYKLIFNISPFPYIEVDFLAFKPQLSLSYLKGTREQYTMLGGILLRRASSFFLHPTITANFLLQMVILFLSIIIGTAPKLRYYLLVMMAAPLLILTFSRAAWLISPFMLLVLIMVKRGQNLNRKKIIVIILSILVVLFSFTFQPVKERFVEIFLLKENSVRSHFALSKAAYKMFKQSPIFGIGSGMFKEEYPKMEELKSEFAMNLRKMDAHNMFLQTIAENGMVGLMALLWLLYSFFKVMLNAISIEKEGYYKDILWGLTLAMATTLLMNLTTNAFKVETFWIILGLGFAAGSITLREREYVDY